MLSGAREAGCFGEVAALHSDHLRQVPLCAVIQWKVRTSIVQSKNWANRAVKEKVRTKLKTVMPI